MLHRTFVLLLAACGGSAVQPTAPAQPSAPQEPVVTGQGIGPLTAQTPATLAGLREKLLGFEVKPVNRPDGLEFEVKKGGEVYFYVIPDPDDEGKILNVHITNPKLVVQNKPLAIGKLATAADAQACECWGERPTCFRKGDHVAASFDRSCSDDDDANMIRRKVIGMPVARIVWSPNGFATDADVGGDEYGGLDDGGGLP